MNTQTVEQVNQAVQTAPVQNATVAGDWNSLLLNNLTDLTEWVKTSANGVGKFAADQVPLYIQEYLNWYFWDNLIGFLLPTLFVLVSAVFLLKNIKGVLKDIEDDVFRIPTLTVIISSVVFLFSFMGLLFDGIHSGKEAIKVAVAPRLIITEKVVELTRSLKP